MRTDTPSPFSQAVARFRGPLARARRGIAAPRGALAAVAVVAALALLLHAGSTATAPGTGQVRGGERFSADDQLTIGRALAAKHIPARVNRLGQVEVAADELNAANDVVAKLDVGPRSLRDIEHSAREWSLWDPPGARDLRAEQGENEALAAMVRHMDGIVDAYVKVQRHRPRGGARQAPPAAAFVFLETQDDREADGETIEKIQTLVAGYAPDVKREAVTVFDRKRQYVGPDNPLLGAQNRTRAYKDELRQKIEDNLTWLKGATVIVQVTPPPVSPAPAAAVTAPAAAAPPPPAPPAEVVSETEPPFASMGVNQPLELMPDPAPPRALPPSASAPPAEAEPVAAEVAPETPPRVRVCVQVPRSFYLKAVPEREPSREDLQSLIERTQTSIRKVVEVVVPPQELDGEVTILTILDELPARPSPPSGAARVRQDIAWWAPAAAAGVATALALAVGLRVVAGRRPASRPLGRGGDPRARYKIDEATDPGPGPSERVRELIRLSPEAAASVLNRWTQGGTIE